MPKASPSAVRDPLCFVDGRGGAFAALAAAIAHAHGRGDALAAASSAVDVPAEIGVVLDEIGLTAPEVHPVAKLARDVRRVDLASWELSLFDGEGSLERLSAARIARDRVERRVEALLATG
jgi:hypothetical protein